MIPSIKNIVYKEIPIYFGKIEVKYSDFPDIENSVDLIRRRLIGDKSISLIIKKKDGEDCSYSISVKENGIMIEATTFGLFPSLSTLSGQINYGEMGSFLFEQEISDSARFLYRGVMVDEARHFLGEKEIKNILDLMFKTKMNVFHWHLSDDQGFRIALSGYENLDRVGSTRKGSIVGGYLNQHFDNKTHSGIYTEDKIKEIIEYAKIRGIKIIPEIDLPGHFSAVLASYPKYTCEGGQFDVPGKYGILENILCLGNGEGKEFAKNLLYRVASLFGGDYLHIGFDEIKSDKLKNCPKCQKRIKELNLPDEKALIENFRCEVRDFLEERGVKVICWNDGLKEVDGKVLVQHWKPNTEKETAERINNGQKMIMSDFFNVYMDYPYAMTPLLKTYNHNPIFDGVLKTDNVIGIETPIWTEWVTSHDKLAFNCYYRICAIAEIAWNEDKPTYPCFIEELRKKEEFLFEERLDIPEKMLNPKGKFFKMLAYSFDSDSEVKKWRKSKTKN